MAPPKPHRRPRRPAVQTERPEVRFHVFGTSGTVWIQRTDTLSKRVAIALRWLIDDSPVLALADQNRRPSEAHLPRWQVSRKDGFGQSSVRLQFAIARGLAPADIAAEIDRITDPLDAALRPFGRTVRVVLLGADFDHLTAPSPAPAPRTRRPRKDRAA